MAFSGKDDPSKFLIKTEKASGKIWLLMENPLPSEEEIARMTAMIEEKTEGRTTAIMLNKMEQECARMPRSGRVSSGERKEE